MKCLDMAMLLVHTRCGACRCVHSRAWILRLQQRTFKNWHIALRICSLPLRLVSPAFFVRHCFNIKCRTGCLLLSFPVRFFVVLRWCKVNHNVRFDDSNGMGWLDLKHINVVQLAVVLNHNRIALQTRRSMLHQTKR